MAVYASNPSSKAGGPFSSAAPPGLPQHNAPAGTFLPGTKVQIGTHRVVIERYLSEGGFAHVYVVRLPRPVDGNEKAVLKRVAVPDKDHLANMRTEVETMKRLRGHKQIVKYIDSHASQLKGGGYEVFLLMEFCQGGGLIDFMNTRLQNRLTEPEILKIFTDIAEGVAAMHYLKPVLLHRDLKVENVLIGQGVGGKKTYKLCDFGSAAAPRPAAANAAEARLVEDDIQRHTTMQYRSPEMIDVYRKIPIDEKSDIWALGVFLYKLCYYTTPFEDVGQSAILNAKFKYPAYPRFSDQLKLLIATMLRERPGDRPNIYQVLQKACQLDGRDLPVRDIYAHRSQSESRKDQVIATSPSGAQSRVGAMLSPPPTAEKQEIPDIAPMRRGRPTKPVSHHGSAKPSPSPLRMVDQGQAQSDPFALLDSGKKGTADELSSKFPTLDEFSLMTDGRQKFAFDAAPERQSQGADPALAQRVTNALADQAFLRAPSPQKPAKPTVADKPATVAKSSAVLEKTRSMEQRETSSRSNGPPPVPQKSTMISTGTMTSPSPPPTAAKPISDRPVWKVPFQDTAATLPRPVSTGEQTSSTRAPEPAEKNQSRLARLLQQDATQSQSGLLEHTPRSPTSSRPSLEGGRPDPKEIDAGLTRSRSLDIRKRPLTVNMGSRPTHINDREVKRHDYEANFVSAELDNGESTAESDINISSDVDWLRAREEEEKERKGHHKRLSSGSKHGKRTSLPHMALTGTKHILTGRFGDAFKKFEGGHSSPPSEHHHHHQHHSPLLDTHNGLPTIPASETTELSEDRAPLDETEDLSPEMRRELEKRELEAEEKRVAQAGAAYRQRVMSRGGGAASGVTVNRATTIQSKVQSLISDNNKPATKTATGYGRYTNEAPLSEALPEHAQQTVPVGIRKPATLDVRAASAPVPSSGTGERVVRPQKPAAPLKPQVLRNAQIVTDVPGGQADANAEISPEDWENKFNQRYPSLSGLEMVERDIESSKTPTTKVREV